MKFFLTEILDEMVQKFADVLVAEIFMEQLVVQQILSRTEKELVDAEKFSSTKIKAAVSLLFPKPDNVLDTIIEIFNRCNWEDAREFLLRQITEKKSHLDKIEQEIEFTELTKKQISVRQDLISHYKVPGTLEYMIKYWDQIVPGNKLRFTMTAFFNDKQERKILNKPIENEKDLKKIEKIENRNIDSFGDMFMHNMTHVAVTGDAGYGKSTTVCELVREWSEQKKDWTAQFRYVFIFFLGELEENDCRSLTSLLKIHLSSKSAEEIADWMEEGEFQKKVLFVFDGLNEKPNILNEKNNEIHKLIYGTSCNMSRILITCRSSSDIRQTIHRMCFVLKLNGFTKEGAIKQLNDLGFKTGEGFVLPPLLKVPLFNVMYGTIQTRIKLESLTTCSLMENYVHVMFKKGKIDDKGRVDDKGKLDDKFKQSNLQMVLGMMAQNKSSMLLRDKSLGNETFRTPKVKLDEMYLLIELGLLHEKSTLTNFIFPHYLFAEYFAAYYWSERVKSFKINFVNKWGRVQFNHPINHYLFCTEWFSCFLTKFNSDYKHQLWRLYNGGTFPLFDEVTDLKIQKTFEVRDNTLVLRFPRHTNWKQLEKIFEKFEFGDLSPTTTSEQQAPAPKRLCLYFLEIKSSNLFAYFNHFDELYLAQCTIKIPSQEFFQQCQCRHIEFDLCRWKKLNEDYTEPNDHVVQQCEKISLIGPRHSFLTTAAANFRDVGKDILQQFTQADVDAKTEWPNASDFLQWAILNLFSPEENFKQYFPLFFKVCTDMYQPNLHIGIDLKPLIDFVEQDPNYEMSYVIYKYFAPYLKSGFSNNENTMVQFLSDLPPDFKNSFARIVANTMLPQNRNQLTFLVDIITDSTNTIVDLLRLFYEANSRRNKVPFVDESVEFIHFHLAQITELNLYHCFWDKNDVRQLATIFNSESLKLQKLTLCYCIDHCKSTKFMESIANLKRLRSLDISNCKIPDDCLEKLQLAIRSLLLSECLFQNEPYVGYNKALLDAIDSSNSLRKLQMKNCNLPHNVKFKYFIELGAHSGVFVYDSPLD